MESIDLERYVRGVVETESWVPATEPPGVAERMFELQALLARTYAIANLGRHRAQGADLCDTTHCQLFRDARPAGAGGAPFEKGVSRSTGRIVTYSGSPILALYHSACGGATSAADTVWGGQSRPYLRSVVDGFCARSAVPWRTRLERADLVRALDGDVRTRVNGRLDAIDVVSRDEGGRAALVSLAGARSPVVRGDELRTVLSQAFGVRAVRSTRFQVSREGTAFVFEGTGFGHGVGLCQAGALALLRDGRSVAQVLEHYYPGTAISAAPPLQTLRMPDASPPIF